MNPWSEEKVRQLDTGSMTAFGIRITSRHAYAQEMIELIGFAREACRANVNMYVTEAFYDSGSSCCNFTFSAALDSAGESARQAVLAAARETISQFDWFGAIQHGRPLLEAEDDEPS
ncbi:hypothetical protein [Ramlibacter sp.]|uniref:hypothetical protein n=1 Tax=Ramlibacter sp. TaxID=1917967 RepID=UPI0017EB0C01|nr:hypothetical protein [Ramlibacter sp.]MBA2672621.1 hypothetical protein [Ramlibacter sp.]